MSAFFESNQLLIAIIHDAGRLLLRVGPILIAAIFLAETARLWLGNEKLKLLLAGRHSITGRLRAAALGAVLPFCECGAFPVMLGLIRAGVPTSAVLTFFLISPVVSMPAFMMLISIFNLPFALIYLLITVTAGLIGGFLLEQAGKHWGIFKAGIAVGNRSKDLAMQTAVSTACGSTCSAASADRSCCDSQSSVQLETGQQLNPVAIISQSWQHTLKLLKKIAPYMGAVIIVSSLMRNLISPDLIRNALVTWAPFDILLGALAGIPIYTGDCAMIALVTPLISATGALGAGIAFIISGSGTSISGIIFMSSVFQKRFLAIYIFTVFCIALIAGYLVSLLPRLGII